MAAWYDGLKQFDVIVGRFAPKRTDDLKPWAAPFLGKVYRWLAQWRIDEEDGGPYVGQWAMSPVNEQGVPAVMHSGRTFGWAPSSDIEPVDCPDGRTVREVRCPGCDVLMGWQGDRPDEPVGAVQRLNCRTDGIVETHCPCGGVAYCFGMGQPAPDPEPDVVR